MPILVNKMLMGPSYILLRQTALVLLLHLVLATKVTADIDWLVEHCGFPEKLLQFAHASDHSKEGVSSWEVDLLQKELNSQLPWFSLSQRDSRSLAEAVPREVDPSDIHCRGGAGWRRFTVQAEESQSGQCAHVHRGQI